MREAESSFRFFALRSVFGCQLAAAPLPAGSSKTLSIIGSRQLLA
jgi:hypothetical protein